MVPFCGSIKSRLAHQQMQAQVQQKALLQRRIAQMRSASGGAMAASVQAAAQPQSSGPAPQTPQSGQGTAPGPGPAPSPAAPAPDGKQPPAQGPSANVLMAVKQVRRTGQDAWRIQAAQRRWLMGYWCIANISVAAIRYILLSV